ncbi:MAG: VWA domain-containing protein [Rhodoferax sp.]
MADRSALPQQAVFQQEGCHALMDPKGLKARESRDSADHPNALAVAFALDVTGSMGDIPDLLARQELPTFMKLLNACHIPDPQLLFMAVGDATSDKAPLQIGQFESTAELMDQWLTWTYLEGGGGGSGSESYELAFYLLAEHTDLDCWIKRRKKGYLFMTGDELPYPAVSRHQIEALVGTQLDEDVPIEDVIAAASETYHLFFLIPDLRRRKNCEKRWRQLLGDHVICMESAQDTCTVAAAIVGLTEKVLPNLDAVAKTLGDAGISSERTSSTLRALSSYAALIDPNAPPRTSATGAIASGARSWWRKLFA